MLSGGCALHADSVIGVVIMHYRVTSGEDCMLPGSQSTCRPLCFHPHRRHHHGRRSCCSWTSVVCSGVETVNRCCRARDAGLAVLAGDDTTCTRDKDESCTRSADKNYHLTSRLWDRDQENNLYSSLVLALSPATIDIILSHKWSTANVFRYTCHRLT